MDFIATPAGIAGAIPGMIFGLVIAALLLRSACDLCGVDPSPGFLRCLLITVIQGALNALIGLGVGVGVGAAAAALDVSDDAATLLSIPLTLVPSAIIGTIINLIAFKTGIIRAFLIWLVNLLLNLLVGAVVALVLLGAMAGISGVSRLF